MTHLRVKLLLRAGVTILAAVSAVTLGGLAPLVAMLHVGTGSGPVWGGERGGRGSSGYNATVNDSATIEGAFSV